MCQAPYESDADLSRTFAGIIAKCYDDDAKAFASACHYYADVSQLDGGEPVDIHVFADGSCAVLFYDTERVAEQEDNGPSGWIIDATPETAIAYAHGGGFGRNNLAGYAEALLLRLKAKAEARAAGIAYKAIKLGDV